jgi:uncharacterized membrane protein SpoIIM required for sporulation
VVFTRKIYWGLPQAPPAFVVSPLPTYMRETNFIDQNKKKWKDFERVLDGQYKDPEKLKDLFIQVTDDLSYSRTFYSNRSVRVYLNNLAQRVFFSIYKSKRSPFRRLLYFWTDDLPQLVYESRQAFRLSLAVFVVSMLVGVFSSIMDPEFANLILGDSYVRMTMENIDSGDPMAVYKDRGAFNMSLGITLNNLMVAFFTFILGALFGVGTLIILISNAIMVGTFQYFFIERGLFAESFLTIWIHGTLEISAIVIAGAAGLTMGRGLVFPGTYTRLQAFQRSARRGLKIMIGIAPIIILAGFVEGYLTRFTETPDFVRALFIILCFAFVMVYFVWYPVRKARLGFKSPLKDMETPPDKRHTLRVDAIKSSGEIFADVFTIFRSHYSRLFLLALATSIFYCLLAFSTAPVKPTEAFSYPNVLFGTVGEIEQFFVNEQAPFIPLINLVVFGVLTLLGQYFVVKSIRPDTRLDRKTALALFGKLLIGILAMQLIMLTTDWYTLLLIVMLFPLPMLYNFILQVEKKDIGLSAKRMFFLLGNNYARVLGLFILLLLLSLFFFMIVDSSLINFFFNYISWVIYLEQSAMDQLSVILLTFVSVFVLHLLYMLVISGLSIQYFTLREIKEADHLKEKIKQIGSGKKIQGLERE